MAQNSVDSKQRTGVRTPLFYLLVVTHRVNSILPKSCRQALDPPPKSIARFHVDPPPIRGPMLLESTGNVCSCL